MYSAILMTFYRNNRQNGTVDKHGNLVRKEGQEDYVYDDRVWDEEKDRGPLDGTAEDKGSFQPSASFVSVGGYGWGPGKQNKYLLHHDTPIQKFIAYAKKLESAATTTSTVSRSSACVVKISAM